MTFEAASAAWASGQLGIPVATIERVEFEVEDLGPGCPTCGHGGGTSLGISVALVEGRTRHIEYSPYDFGKLIREIVEAGQGPAE